MTLQGQKTVCIFGGSGFIGRAITEVLAAQGYRIKIATRTPEAVYDLKPFGTVGQICAIPCDYSKEESLRQAVRNCDAVINLIGILFEKGKNNFQRAHIDLPQKIAKAAAEEKVKQFLHISALGIDRSSSRYAKSKLKGEEAVRGIFPAVTILRPSVVFGPGDGFFNMFAKLSVFLPALPLIGGGKTKFQPVYVGDIAAAAAKILNDQAGDHQGKIYELGGPDIVTFQEIYEILFAQTNRRRALISLPFPVAKIQGAIMGLLPKPPLTLDQVRSLQFDNIVADHALKFTDLGITPTNMGSVLPRYLACYKKGGRYAEKKAG